ncbi:hypothetical protein HOD08_01210 [bacterium]|nr:hypothetical protein [bacterium]
MKRFLTFVLAVSYAVMFDCAQAAKGHDEESVVCYGDVVHFYNSYPGGEMQKVTKKLTSAQGAALGASIGTSAGVYGGLGGAAIGAAYGAVIGALFPGTKTYDVRTGPTLFAMYPAKDEMYGVFEGLFKATAEGESFLRGSYAFAHVMNIVVDKKTSRFYVIKGPHKSKERFNCKFGMPVRLGDEIRLESLTDGNVLFSSITHFGGDEKNADMMWAHHAKDDGVSKSRNANWTVEAAGGSGQATDDELRGDVLRKNTPFRLSQPTPDGASHQEKVFMTLGSSVHELAELSWILRYGDYDDFLHVNYQAAYGIASTETYVKNKKELNIKSLFMFSDPPDIPSWTKFSTGVFERRISEADNTFRALAPTEFLEAPKFTDDEKNLFPSSKEKLLYGSLIKLRHKDTGCVMRPLGNYPIGLSSNNDGVFCTKERGDESWFIIKGPHSDSERWNCVWGSEVKSGDMIRLESLNSHKNLSFQAGYLPQVNFDRSMLDPAKETTEDVFDKNISLDIQQTREASLNGEDGIGGKEDNLILKLSGSAVEIKSAANKDFYLSSCSRSAPTNNVMDRFETEIFWESEVAVELPEVTEEEYNPLAYVDGFKDAWKAARDKQKEAERSELDVFKPAGTKAWVVEDVSESTSTDETIIAAGFEQVEGLTLKSVSVGENGAIAGVNGEDNLVIYDPVQDNVRTLDYKVISAALTSDGIVWGITDDGQVVMVDGDKVQEFAGDFKTIAADSGGRAYAFGEDGVASVYEGGGWQSMQVFVAGISAGSSGRVAYVPKDDLSRLLVGDYKDDPSSYENIFDSVPTFTEGLKIKKALIGNKMGKSAIGFVGHNGKLYLPDFKGKKIAGFKTQKSGGKDIVIVDASLGDDGTLIVLGGSPDSENAFSVFTKLLTPLPPKGSDVTLFVETTEIKEDGSKVTIRKALQADAKNRLVAVEQDEVSNIDASMKIAVFGRLAGFSLPSRKGRFLSTVSSTKQQGKTTKNPFMFFAGKTFYDKKATTEQFIPYEMEEIDGGARLKFQNKLTGGFLQADENNFVRFMGSNGNPIMQINGSKFVVEFASEIVLMLEEIRKLESSIDQVERLRNLLEDYETVSDESRLQTILGWIGTMIDGKKESIQLWNEFIEQDEDGDSGVYSLRELLDDTMSEWADSISEETKNLFKDIFGNKLKFLSEVSLVDKITRLQETQDSLRIGEVAIFIEELDSLVGDFERSKVLGSESEILEDTEAIKAMVQSFIDKFSSAMEEDDRLRVDDMMKRVLGTDSDIGDPVDLMVEMQDKARFSLHDKAKFITYVRMLLGVGSKYVSNGVVHGLSPSKIAKLKEAISEAVRTKFAEDDGGKRWKKAEKYWSFVENPVTVENMDFGDQGLRIKVSDTKYEYHFNLHYIQGLFKKLKTPTFPEFLVARDQHLLAMKSKLQAWARASDANTKMKVVAFGRSSLNLFEKWEEWNPDTEKALLLKHFKRS